MEGNFEASLRRHRRRHHHEKYFFGIIWDGLLISEVKLQLCLIFQNFQNSRHSQVAANFFTGCCTRNWIYQQDSHAYFRYFELFIYVIAQILTEIYQFQNLTDFVTWWCHQWREAVFNISKFSKWPPFWARDNFFQRKWYRKLNIRER